MSFYTITVGRSKNADIHINDPEISRRHVEITRTQDGRLYLVDAGSTSGTYIWRHENWVVLKQGFIKPDDVIALGKRKMRVEEIYQYFQSAQHQSGPAWEPISIKPQRSALTGEIENH